MNILVLNAGSSSFKSSLYRLTEAEPKDLVVPLWTGAISWNSTGAATLTAKTADESIEEERSQTDRQQDIHDLLNWLWSGKTQVVENIHAIDIVGNRVVHGGDKYRQPTLIDDAVKAEIDRLSIYAPLHNPANLIGIAAISAIAKDTPQIAVFDTAFFRDLSEVAYTYPVPDEWLERGIRKYGFHGISHQYCTQRAAELLGRDLGELRLISCHLGNGCSLAAVKSGRCIDTTMGFTPLDGLMMGTRCGSIDPGIILHLLREREYTVVELDRILNFESGLLGVSGVSNDLREIDRAIASGNDRAKLALDMYIDRLASKIGSLLPALGGMDALIFTGGVGEHHAGIRAAVASKLAFLGVEIDPDLNKLSIPPDRDVATAKSAVRLLAIHTQEEWEIARACWAYLHDRH
ncbi:acetate kinase [Chamaesiphon sp. GL140_3_metabinner_50]|uniref:acetate/propionate family kinase n=1 Tax=Chamaesiphon sp. GL140_3_metabinner_50 TaxID=2970812 RepID=UPI0025E30E2E|nr:acetate kinase [Chamaesiphon sp. GL140_3_metabinner_50]